MSDTSKATQRPWHWGSSWNDYDKEPWSDDEFAGPKYADIALHGPNREVIPLRIDHYNIEWDSADGLGDLSRADREFIVEAVNSYDRNQAALKAAVELARMLPLDALWAETYEVDKHVLDKGRELREALKALEENNEQDQIPSRWHLYL